MLRAAPPVLVSGGRELSLLPHALARHAAGPRAREHAAHQRRTTAGASAGEGLNMTVGRREALKRIGIGAGAATFGSGVPGSGRAYGAARPPRAAAAKTPEGPYKLLFMLADQERYFRPGELPRDYRLPAHERLMKKGIVFEDHHINSCVCTPSRSVLYTGQHIQHTKMFDNTNFPWITSMSTDLPTIGDMLRQAG